MVKVKVATCGEGVCGDGGVAACATLTGASFTAGHLPEMAGLLPGTGQPGPRAELRAVVCLLIKSVLADSVKLEDLRTAGGHCTGATWFPGADGVERKDDPASIGLVARIVLPASNKFADRGGGGTASDMSKRSATMRGRPKTCNFARRSCSLVSKTECIEGVFDSFTVE